MKQIFDLNLSVNCSGLADNFQYVVKPSLLAQYEEFKLSFEISDSASVELCTHVMQAGFLFAELNLFAP